MADRASAQPARVDPTRRRDGADAVDTDAPYSPIAVSRAVGWASYNNQDAFRVDLIVRRDLADSSPQTDVDGDIVVRVMKSLAVTAGTSRFNNHRTFYAGLRLPLSNR